MLPIPLLHFIFLLLPRREKPLITGTPRFFLLLLTNHALWEVAAESYVASTDRRAMTAPRPRWASILYDIFWASATIFALFGTFLLLKRDRSA